jgi:hypothetical protein
MATLIKNLFFKKTLSNEELHQQWKSSSKSIQDFVQFIRNLTNNQDKFLLQEIENILIRSFKEVENLIVFLNKFIQEKK